MVFLHTMKNYQMIVILKVQIINVQLYALPGLKITINKKQLLSWQQQQNKNGFINLYLPKIGIMHEQAKIAKIKKITHKTPTNKNQHLVTAVYMRYANVLKYKIKDINTGKTEEITTTPEHKFYETTYKKFIPISKLGPDNTITNASNHHLKIICTNNRQNNCGTAPLNSLQKVYNMQVEKAHNYFVGNTKALVHNGYDYYFKCANCHEIHAEKYLFFPFCSRTEDQKHYLVKFYQCEFCGMSNRKAIVIVNHEIIHDNILGELSCSVCNTIFIEPSTYSAHMKMHSQKQDMIFSREYDRFISFKDKLDMSREYLGPGARIKRKALCYQKQIRSLPRKHPIINFTTLFMRHL